jgi:hypothetical protein
MHRVLAYIAFTWLTLAGTLHFAVDVVAQYACRRRSPRDPVSPESPEPGFRTGLRS